MVVIKSASIICTLEWPGVVIAREWSKGVVTLDTTHGIAVGLPRNGQGWLTGGQWGGSPMAVPLVVSGCFYSICFHTFSSKSTASANQQPKGGFDWSPQD